jgi:hypothetical protein
MGLLNRSKPDDYKTILGEKDMPMRAIGRADATRIRKQMAAEKKSIDEVELDFQFTNTGSLQSKKEAERTLEGLEFFESRQNQRLFDEGKIKVYEEPCGMEAIMILNTATDQSIFVDYRSL